MIPQIDIPPTRALLNSVSSNARGVVRKSLAGVRSKHSSLIADVSYSLRTLHLFAASDLKTIPVWVSFGLFTCLAARLQGERSVMGGESQGLSDALLQFLPSLFNAILWTWLNLVPFCIDNQRQRDGLDEDALNKPWRPIPAKRITVDNADRLLPVMYTVAVLASFALGGGIDASLTLIPLGLLYNTFGGSEHWFPRSFLNALGFLAFGLGSASVFLGSGYVVGADELFPSTKNAQWAVALFSMVFMTIHAADMRDQEGDLERQRLTIPLVFGDAAARWLLSVSVVGWTAFAVVFWNLPLTGLVTMPLLALAALVSVRAVLKRTESADKKTYLYWNLWLLSVYSLPVLGCMAATQ